MRFPSPSPPGTCLKLLSGNMHPFLCNKVHLLVKLKCLIRESLNKAEQPPVRVSIH